MKATLFILFYIFAIMQQISGENSLWKLLAKPPTPMPNSCNSMHDWSVIVDPQDCRKFYGCVNNVSQHLECAENYYFNSLTMHCMPGNCHQSAIQCKVNEVLPVANECQKFTFCKQGKRELYNCPNNQFFDSEMSVCLPKRDSPDALCSCGDVSNNNIFSNPEDCQTYYTCVNGKAELVLCPKGQYFDTDINSCLLDDDGICLEEPTMSPPVSPQNYDFCDANDVTGMVFFSSPTSCNIFFVCVQGQLLIRECPEGLYFDDELRFCRADKTHICRKRHIVEEQN